MEGQGEMGSAQPETAPGLCYRRVLLKLSGEALMGTPMPPVGMLPQSSIDAVETWIRQGANQN